MKSILVTLALAIAVPAFALTPAPVVSDQQKLIAHLEHTSAKFLKSVDGLSEAQWNYKATPEKWSVAQCAEHIAAAESFIRSVIEKSLSAPATDDVVKQGIVKDDNVLKLIVDRSNKFKAPEPLIPGDRFGSPSAAVDAFRKERAETLKLAQSDKDLRKYATQHPGFGQLDAHGWVLFLSGHTERHTLQIEEVKASEGFPKE